MSKKKKKVLIIVILILIVLYFLYKGINLLIYSSFAYNDSEFESLKSGFKITDSIDITHKETSNYLTFENVKIRNDFENFKKMENNGSSIVNLLLESTQGNKLFIYGIAEPKISVYKNDDIDYSNYSKIFDNLDREKILKNHNINNDLDLIKYLSNRKILNPNIFTSVKMMKEDYFFNYLVMLDFPKVYQIKLIEGLYNGYILDCGEGVYEVNILKDNKIYYFVFMGKDYTFNYIEDFLNTLVIE